MPCLFIAGFLSGLAERGSLYLFPAEQIPLAEYCRANDGKRNDAEHVIDDEGRFALISNHFFYFGRNAIDISEIPKKHLNHPFEKRGQGYGYPEFLEAIADPKHERHGELLEWIGGEFDPEHFDTKTATMAMMKAVRRSL